MQNALIVIIVVLLSWTESAAQWIGGIPYTSGGQAQLPPGVALSTPSLGTTPLTITYTAGTGGVTAETLVKLDSSGNVVTAATTDVGIIGIAMSTVSAAASVEVATRGKTTCIADNTTVIGDVLIPGTSTGGRCRDSGISNNSLVANTVQVVGKALSVATVGNPVTLQLFGPGHYGSSFSAAAGRECNTQIWLSPVGTDALPSYAATSTAGPSLAGLVHCARVTAQCSVTTPTGIYARVGTAAATCGGGAIPCQAGLAIYNSAGTTLLGSSQAPISATTGVTAISATGLTFSANIAAGTEYLACYATSGSNKVHMWGSPNMTNFGVANYVIEGQNDETHKVLFPADCTGSGTATSSAGRACCTADGVGATCPGTFPASLGTMTAAGATDIPHIIVK